MHNIGTNLDSQNTWEIFKDVGQAPVLICFRCSAHAL